MTSKFRIYMDIVMGVVYIALAGVIVFTKKFGVLELGAAGYWGMASLLALYGSFRIWKGLRDLFKING